MDAQMIETSDQTRVSGEKTFDYDQVTLVLTISEKEFQKVQAATFYNDFASEEAYTKDVLFREIDLDKERHQKLKEANKLKK